jgi:hypothetical protein
MLNGRKFVCALAAAGVVSMSASAMAQWTQNFDTVAGLAPPAVDGTVLTGPEGAWPGALRSSPLGVSGIFQGNPTAFPAHMGATNSYAGMNFQNTSGVGTINTWLMTPELTLQNGDTISFWTRTSTGTQWPDRLELRMSTNGASTNVGPGATDVGDFSTMMLSVNPGLTVVGYPQVWTEFVGTVGGLGGPTQGRFAFRYTVPNGGPSGTNSNYIGIDTVTYTPIPEPAALGLLAGAGFLALRRRSA